MVDTGTKNRGHCSLPQLAHVAGDLNRTLRSDFGVIAVENLDGYPIDGEFPVAAGWVVDAVEMAASPPVVVDRELETVKNVLLIAAPITGNMVRPRYRTMRR